MRSVLDGGKRSISIESNASDPKGWIVTIKDGEHSQQLNLPSWAVKALASCGMTIAAGEAFLTDEED